MKKLLYILLMVAFTAQAEYIDLTGGDMLAEPIQCRHLDDKIYMCVPVEKDGVAYMVLFDRKGEAFIYNITGDAPVLVWARDTI